MWFWFALISAVFGGFRRTSEKRLLQTIDRFTLGWMIQLFSLPLVATILFASGQAINPFQLGAEFWLPLAFAVLIFYPLNTWLFYGSLREGELSKVLPIQALGPAISLLFAFFILHEVPSRNAAIGLAVVVFGLYVLDFKDKKLHNPLAPFMQHRASLYMLGSTVLVSLVVPVEKISIQASNPLMYTAMSTLGAAGILFLIARKYGKRPARYSSKLMWPLTITAAFQGISYLTLVYALSVGPVAYVSAIKSSGILIGAITGIIAFKESVTYTKVISLGLIGCGMLLLAIG
jgi:uncharacterized membrane protein